jgi:hypothetical protein
MIAVPIYAWEKIDSWQWPLATHNLINCTHTYTYKLFCFGLFFGSTEVWTQGLMLLGTASLPLEPLFYVGYFENRVSWTICSGWPWTLILLISASGVARITGVSHWFLALLGFWLGFHEICAPGSFGILIRISWNLWINLEKTILFIALPVPAHEHSTCSLLT